MTDLIIILVIISGFFIFQYAIYSLKRKLRAEIDEVAEEMNRINGNTIASDIVEKVNPKTLTYSALKELKKIILAND